MTAILLGDYAPNSPEWDGLRSRGLGGSEIAAVVGLSPWQSRFSLWHRKRGTLGKQEVNRGMEWGTRLEDVICDAFAETRDMLDVERAGTYRHSDRAWQIANPDRLLSDDEFGRVGILETKTAHQYDAHEWGQGPEDIPPYYRCQALWYLDVLELPVAHVAVLIGGSDYREYQIPYVPDEAEWLREQGRLFWQTVVDGVVPPIDSHDKTYEAVRQMNPLIEAGVDIDLDPELWAEYQASKAESDTSIARHQQAKSRVLDQMGQANYAHVNGEAVLRRQPGRGNSISLYPVAKPKKRVAA